MPDHRLTLISGATLTVTGVTEVAAFDDTAAVLQTPLGPLTVLGENLRLKALTPDNTTTVEGQITALTYDPPKPPNPLRKLFPR